MLSFEIRCEAFLPEEIIDYNKQTNINLLMGFIRFVLGNND